MTGIRWTEDELNIYLARIGAKARKVEAAANTADCPSDVESDSCLIASQKNVGQAVHPLYCIHIHSKRRRLTDPDGLYAKSAIDGLVRSGILPDDSREWVKEVTFSQEKSKSEETIIEVWEIR